MPLPTTKPWLSLTVTLGTAKAPVDGTSYWVRLPDANISPMQLKWSQAQGAWTQAVEPLWPQVPWYLAPEYRAV